MTSCASRWSDQTLTLGLRDSFPNRYVAVRRRRILCGIRPNPKCWHMAIK
jgi:hypothetical protein